VTDLAFAIASAALEKGTEQGLGLAAQILLQGAVPEPVTAVVAAGLAAATKALINGLAETTRKTDLYLVTMLAEPFDSARGALAEVLSVQAVSIEELEECDRQLGVAFDGLRRAHAYAVRTDPAACHTIRLYQCMVASLKVGGAAFAREYVHELRTLSASFLASGAAAKSKADTLDPNRFRAMTFVSTDYVQMNNNLEAVERATEEETQRKSDLEVTSQALKRRASDLNRFCTVVERVMLNRQAILTCPKTTTEPR
jgi:hypothetical protein